MAASAKAATHKPGVASTDTRALLEELNGEAAKFNFWLRTELNTPSQRAWFTDTAGTGGGNLLKAGRVSANQLKALPCHWAWKDYGPYLEKIEDRR